MADGRVVGMVGAYVTPSYEHDEPTGRLTAMVVSEEARGRGIGARLVAAAEAWVRERGARVMMLNSHSRRDRRPRLLPAARLCRDRQALRQGALA